MLETTRRHASKILRFTVAERNTSKLGKNRNLIQPVLIVFAAAMLAASMAARRAPAVDFIDTSVENGSPLWYDVVDNVVRLHLIYGHERAGPNRAAGHIHFVLHARLGATLTLEFRNLDNVWNGQPGSVAGELKTVALVRGRDDVANGTDRGSAR